MKFKTTLSKFLAVTVIFGALSGSVSAPAWSVPVDEYYTSEDAASRSTASVADAEKPVNAEWVNARAQAMNSPSNGPAFRGVNFR